MTPLCVTTPRTAKKQRKSADKPAHSKESIMKILIADKFEESGRIGLRSIGCEISFQPDLKDDALVEAIAKEKPDVLIVRGTKVTEPMLEAGPLKLVVRAARATTRSTWPRHPGAASTSRTVREKTQSPSLNLRSL